MILTEKEGERWGGSWLQRAKFERERALAEYVGCIIKSREAIAVGHRMQSLFLHLHCNSKSTLHPS